MKKGICIFAAAFLMLCWIPPFAAMADAAGKLEADSKNENITVMLQKPAGEDDTVTSLRFWMYVSVSDGNMEPPTFQFSEAVSAGTDTGVRNAAVSKNGSGYVADVILAVKKDQDIFKNGGQTAIGTLSLHPSGQFQAQIGLTAEGASQGSQPVLEYVTGTVQSVQRTSIVQAEPVICLGTAQNTENPSGPGNSSDSGNPSDPGSSSGSENPTGPGSSSGSGDPSDPQNPALPNLPVTPSLPVTPGQPGTSSGAGTGTAGTDSGASQDDTGSAGENPGNTENTDSGQEFNQKTALKLQLAVKNGARKVTFQWNRTLGADGYQIYQYDPDTGKNTRLKTIANPQKTSYSKELEYGTDYSFRVRAFKTGKNGKRTYGRFSQVMHTVTAPAKVTGVTVKKQKQSAAVISWKRIKADGYQIYRSTKKNGKYTRLKTVRDSTAAKYTGISYVQGRKYYYKVRAYVNGTDGKRIYGKFSEVTAAVL